MRDLSALIKAALAAEEGAMFWFLELQFGTYLRYTDCDIDLYYSGNKFETMPFSIGPIKYSAKSSVDKVVIDIQNVDLQMSAVFLNENIMNKWGILRIGFFDNNGVIIDQIFEVFRGLVSTWKLSEPKASITLVNEFIFWNKRTLRKHQSACRWPFKGIECGYSGGETWCDQSYARCTALGNTDNFGGDRWLPDLMEKEIYWGRITNK
jgi:hypothetical protein